MPSGPRGRITEPVSHLHRDRFHAGIGGDRVVEGTDRRDVLVVCEIAGDVAALERVVE